MEMGAGFPGQSISISRINTAGLLRQETSLAMASSRKSLKFENASANIRRLFGSCGGKGRQDVLRAEGAAGLLESDEDLDAWMAHRKSTKEGVGKKRWMAPPHAVGITCVGAGKRWMVSTVSRGSPTGVTGKRDSEYHLAPEPPWGNIPGGECSPAPQEREKARRPSYSPLRKIP